MPSFTPPIRTLMGPGPSDIDPRVLEALAGPIIGHLDPAFIGLMDEVKRLLQYAFQTKNEMTFPVSAPGSAGMECCFVNLVEPGETVVVCVNGVFGGRMKENVDRCGAVPVVVEDTWGDPVSLDKVEQALAAHPEASVLAWVQAETSTGAESDSEALAALARKHKCLTIVDTVTSLGGTPLKVDDWGLDAVYSGTQKCLSCVPGLSPVTFSPAAVEKVLNRSTKVQSWFLDITLLTSYWSGEGRRAYHHTAPINAIYALHEALTLLKEEGLEHAWARHRKNHEALKAGLEALGIEFVVNEDSRLPQLNAVTIPEGIDEAAVRKHLLETHSLEIGAGLGAMAGKIWRIGLMGYASRPENIVKCLSALEDAFTQQGREVQAGVAATRAREVLGDKSPATTNV